MDILSVEFLRSSGFSKVQLQERFYWELEVDHTEWLEVNPSRSRITYFNGSNCYDYLTLAEFHYTLEQFKSKKLI